MDMTALLSVVLVFLALIVAIPAAVLFLEIVAAIFLPERSYSIGSSEREYGRVAVVVPAHNESTGLLNTLLDLRVQLNTHDRLLVVADNCSDDTAAVGRRAGAEVIERDEPDRRGKGFALAYAINYLKADPPDFVIFADADCRVERDVIHTLASICAQTNRPIQSFSSMIAPSNSPLNTHVAEFAWRVKNYIRPRGLSALGLPCQLMGCGMAFPWEIVCNANLASASIVEDLKLGIDLALAGHPATFCSCAAMVSEFPTTPEGLQSQRARWEKGHINIIVAAWPRLMLAAIANRNLQLLGLALDLAIPPLSLLGMLSVGVLTITALANYLGAPSAGMFIALGAFLALVGSVFLAWLRYGWSILPPSSLISILPYIARKFSLYRSIIFGTSSSGWIRTDRTKDPE
jgi:cellulose synthase/poly-beta-1,6-N-acetylglucosamine synthase-like glycosyltransferase